VGARSSYSPYFSWRNLSKVVRCTMLSFVSFFCALRSPDGKKFAVTSGHKCVPVCTYVTKQNWWGAKVIKDGFKSSVVSVAWCVNNKVCHSAKTDIFVYAFIVICVVVFGSSSSPVPLTSSAAFTQHS
jgi:hypothetical protein